MGALPPKINSPCRLFEQTPKQGALNYQHFLLAH